MEIKLKHEITIVPSARFHSELNNTEGTEYYVGAAVPALPRGVGRSAGGPTGHDADTHGAGPAVAAQVG